MHDPSISNHRTQYPIKSGQGHRQCVQWSTTKNWAKDRSIDVIAPRVSVYPTLWKSHEWFYFQLVWLFRFCRFSEDFQSEEMSPGKADDIEMAIDVLMSELEGLLRS